MASPNLDREHHVFLARISEEAERFDEMASHMTAAVKLSRCSDEFSQDERNLLSTAYKHVIGSRRSAWRVITAIEAKEDAAANQEGLEIVRPYRAKIESELSQICDDVLKLLDEDLIPSSGSAEAKVFYLKMKGDYHRYLAEFKKGQDRIDTADDTLADYKSAQDIAVAELAPTHPIRLGLALNFSVFYYEILNSSERACKLAKQAFEEAVSEIETVEEETYKESTLIMQLLRDNLTLWTSDGQESSVEPALNGKTESAQELLRRPDTVSEKSA